MCAGCNTSITMAWVTTEMGLTLCSSCSIYKKDDSANTPSATVQETVTIQSELQAATETEDCSGVANEELVDTTAPETCETDEQEQAEGDREEGKEEDEVQKPQASSEELSPSDSPPKLIIPKDDEKETDDVSKKGSIVDRLKEKLCFVVEEAIKNHITTEDESEHIASSPKGEETPVQSPVAKDPVASEQTRVIQVLLHDLKNDKEMMEKLKGSEICSKTNKNTTGDIEMQTLTDSGSEPDSEASNCAEQDNFVPDESNSTKKKQNNINTVVDTIKERKSSVDEKIDNNSPKEKESTTLTLDDSVEEVPILIIDEGDSNCSDSKRSNVKTDRNRRKGTPAKVFSRSSTSTEFSDNSVTEEQLIKSKGNKEVLDEVSGQFRRPSLESNLTITLVTEDETPQKKGAKDLRSVNISKSLSLSVVNDSAASLDMECAESDMDDQVIVDSVIKKVTPRPTARKTLPNTQKLSDLPQLKEKGIQVTQDKTVNLDVVNMRPSVTLVDQVTSPPPLLNLHSQQPIRINKGQRTLTLRPPSLATNPTSTSSAAKADLGPANLQLDQAVRKMSGHLRSLMEDMLRNMSETGATEATVKALQVEMEKLQWRHRQEISELKHNTDLLVMEIRASLEAEKQRALLDAKHKFELDKEQAIQETKRKQWCAFCQKEAQLYCCWNTAYCSYNCQQSHWMPHMSTCLNKQQGSTADVTPRPAPPRTPNYVPAGQVGYFMNNS